jgi:hypothetical protein
MMKTKMILGLATIAALALPAMAQEGYCYLDRDGDRQTCVSNGYSYTTRVYNGGYYQNYDRDRRWQHEEHERRERMEHERHEWREHHRDRDDR